jgi:hypothetical protein
MSPASVGPTVRQRVLRRPCRRRLKRTPERRKGSSLKELAGVNGCLVAVFGLGGRLVGSVGRGLVSRLDPEGRPRSGRRALTPARGRR